MTMWQDRLRTRHISPLMHNALSSLGRLATRWRSQLQPLQQQTISRWRGLSARERQQMRLMAGVLAGALIWFLLMRPALHTLRYWGSELPRLRAQSTALQEVLAEVGGPRMAQDTASATPAQRIAHSLDQAGLAGSYRVAEADKALHITFEKAVDASRLATWLLHAPAALKLAVQHVTLERIASSASATQDTLVQASVSLAPQTRDNI